MRRIVFVSLAVALVVPTLAWAAGVGNPASTIGADNYGFTMEVENQKKEVDQDPIESRRYLGKVIWGVTDRIDIYARLGTSDLKVYPENAPDFRGRQGMTYGLGGRLLVAEIRAPRILAILDIQGLSYFSKGTARVTKSYGRDVWVEKYKNRYKWNEVQFSFFTVWQRPVWQPYVGFSMVNVFGDVERELYMLTDGAEEFLGADSNEFREDAIPEFIMGMDVQIGGTGRVSGEFRLSNGELSFSVGLSELWR